MRLLDSIGLYLQPPDSRPAREIEADIVEELRGHIELRTLDNIAAGMPPAEASADAVKWTPEQRITWPTKANPVEGMEFSTEEFVELVIADIRSRGKPVDPAQVYLLAWSSGGHGWHGEVYPGIRQGIDWLERAVAGVD